MTKMLMIEEKSVHRNNQIFIEIKQMREKKRIKDLLTVSRDYLKMDLAIKRYKGPA